MNCAVLQKYLQFVEHVGRRRRIVVVARHLNAHRTVLWVAALRGAIGVAQLPLEGYHTRPNYRWDYNAMPLLIASQRGSAEMLKRLPRHRVKVDVKYLTMK